MTPSQRTEIALRAGMIASRILELTRATGKHHVKLILVDAARQMRDLSAIVTDMEDEG